MADQILPDVPPILDADGDPVAGGFIIFYVSGTTTLAPIYADAAGTTPLQNPLPLNAAGRAAQVFISTNDEVAAVIRSASGATIRTIDPCPRAVITGSAASAVSFSPVAGNPATNVQTAIAANTAAIVGFGTQGTTGKSLFQAGTASAARAVLGVETVIDEDSFASDSATRPPSQQSTKAYIGQRVRSYKSAQTAFSDGGLLIFTHGLGGAPDFCAVSLVCVADGDDHLTGDVIQVSPTADSINNGVGIRITPTQAIVRIGADGPGRVIGKTGGANVQLTSTNWGLILTAVRVI